MKLLSRDDLREMARVENGPCVSIYMPTHRAGTDTQQDPIRLKNLMRQAEKQLPDFGIRPGDTARWLKPIQSLVDDETFWQHQSDGLAVFLAEGFFRYYRVPISFEEMAHVGSSFYLKPLMPLLVGDEPFFLLVLSQKEVRFFHGTRDSIREIFVPGMPTSLAEALQWDDPEKQQQYRTVAQGARRTAMYHGHTEDSEDTKENLSRFFHLINKALEPLLAGQHAPLVLAGVDYYFPLYAEANAYPHLLPGGIPGNHDGERPEVLHAKAWEFLKPHVERSRQEAVERFRALNGNGRSSVDLADVVMASHSGRVETLFAPVGVQVWGRFEPESGEVQFSGQKGTDDEDLLNLATVQTFLHGGTVYAVPPEQVPDSALVAAIYRY